VRNITTILFLINIFIHSLNGQSPDLINKSRALFADNKNINSIELYGFVNDENEVQLYLAYDDNDWKGYCYYPQSEAQIYIEGGIVRNNLILDEIGKDSMKIGMWMIGIDQIDHPAKWRDATGNVSFDLILRKLTESNKALDYRHCFCSIYEGTIDGHNYQLKSYINSGKNLRTTFMNYDRMFYYPSIPECLDKDCSQYKLVLDSEEGIRNLVFSPENHKVINSRVNYKNGTSMDVKFSETGFIPFEEMTYMTNMFRIYISYPMIKNQSINDTIRRDVKIILDSLIREMEKCVQNMDELESRLSVSANGWFDLGLINDEIYSGVLAIQSDCSDNIRSYPMVYNLKTGQKIDFAAQFTEGFNIKFFFSQYLKEKIKKVPEFKTPVFKNHLKPESFQNIYVSDQGIVFATDFNTLLGSQRIVLPFTDLKGVIKRKSPLKKMIND
jgi:hypothetical protein